MQRKRWAVPLLHAGGWYVALSALLGLAVVTGGYFLIAPPSGHIEKSVALSAGKILLLLGVFGVAVPLGLIAIYQRRYLPHLCAKVDPKPRWTDGVPEPMLMLMMSCWFGMLVMLTLSSLKQCSFPFFGHMLDARSGGYVIYPVILAGLFVAVRWVLARQRKGWWLSLGLFAFMAVSTAITFWQLPWNTVLTAWGLPTDPIADAQPSRLAMLVALGCYVPQMMVLLMARGCFPKPEDEELEKAMESANAETPGDS